MNSFLYDISIENLSKSYNGRVLFDSLSLQIPKGSKVAVTGKSGSGKSTLINILLGFINQDSGIVRLFETDIKSTSIHKLRKDISWVPQELYADIPIVKDLLLLPFCYHNNKKQKPSSESIVHSLNRFGLNKEILDVPVSDISGGEKQRIFLAASSLLNRKMYFLDEPTSALDPESKMKTADYFLNDCSATVVAVTHDNDWIEKSDIVVNMSNNGVEKK